MLCKTRNDEDNFGSGWSQKASDAHLLLFGGKNDMSELGFCVGIHTPLMTMVLGIIL